MPESNRIEVQLSLIASDDIQLLKQALSSLHTDAQSITQSTNQSGGLRARMVTSGGVPSDPTSIAGKARASGYGGIGQQLMNGDWGEQAHVGRTGGLRSVPGGIYGGAKSAAGVLGKISSKLDDHLGSLYALQTYGAKAANFGHMLGTGLYGGGFTAAGTQLGASNSGIGGFGIGSNAWQTGVLNSLYGQFAGITNPNLREGMATAGAAGWNPKVGIGDLNPFAASSNTPGMQVSRFAAKSITAGAGQDTTQQWVESLRYGGTNVAQLSARLKELGGAAKAAHENVQGMTSQIQAGAMGMQQQFGVNSTSAFNQGTALAQATGLPGDATMAIMGNKTLTGMATAMAGGDMAKAFYGRNAGLYQFKALEKMIAPQLGYADFKGVAQALKDPKQRHAIVNKLLWLYQGAPDLFNGLTPQALLSMIEKTGGNVSNTFHAMSDLNASLGGGKGAAGLLTRGIGELTHSGILTQSQIKNTLAHAGSSVTARAQALINAEGAAMGKKTEDTATGKTSITLTGYAAKILKVAADQADVHPPDTATKPNLGRFQGYGRYGAGSSG